MADRTIKVLTAALPDELSLATLDEIKLMLGVHTSDTTEDMQLQLFTDISSATVARLCNRIFARQELREWWRELNGGHRIFPSQWPIKQADLLSVESPEGYVLDPGIYQLDEQGGKVSIYSSTAFTEPVVVHYWGGYALPDEAPYPLKSAVGLLVQQQKLRASMGQVGGVRMLSHKDSRVMFHDPNKLLQAALGAAATPMQSSIMQILQHYIHFEV